MIHRQGQQPPALLARPVGGDVQQGDGVAAAGQGQRQRMFDVGLKPGRQAGADSR